MRAAIFNVTNTPQFAGAAGSVCFHYTFKPRRPADELTSGYLSKDVLS
jgi:hypothetical protein